MIRWSYLSGPGELLNDVASSVKWSDPGHFLESQGNFFVISMYLSFTYF